MRINNQPQTAVTECHTRTSVLRSFRLLSFKSGITRQILSFNISGFLLWQELKFYWDIGFQISAPDNVAEPIHDAQSAAELSFAH